MANNKKYTYDKLAEVNSNGIDIALFPQIRGAIADRMKEIFGNDIDLSTASADGQYINMESLIFNNMYGLISYLFNNLNPNTASGKYLDVLASLSNVKRKGPSRSTAVVLVKYVGTANNYVPEAIIAQDRNGVEWTWKNPVDTNGFVYEFNNGDDPVYLTFTCNNLGATEAYKGTADSIDWNNVNFLNTNGSIYLELTTQFKLYQYENAVLGAMNESDTSLRNRRARYIGGNSQTTQVGLETDLYNYAAVEDVYVFNNATGVRKDLIDNAEVLNHDVYIAIRYKENIDLPKTRVAIAQIIYNNLTAGVNTSDGLGNGGVNPIVGGTMTHETIEYVSGYDTNVYWKECAAVTPTLEIEFETLTGYIPGTSPTVFSTSEQAIVTTMINYLNNLQIGAKITPAEIQISMMAGDLKPNGTNSFIPTSCEINGDTTPYESPLTYFKYTEANFEFDYTGVKPKLTIL